MDPNLMEATSPPNFGSPQSPVEMKPDPSLLQIGGAGGQANQQVI